MSEIKVSCAKCGGTGVAEKKVIVQVKCSSCRGKGHVMATKTEFKKPASQEGE